MAPSKPSKPTPAAPRLRLRHPDGAPDRFVDKAMVSLIDSSGWKHLDLVVIPPGTTPAVAERALDLASDNEDRHRADAIMQLATDRGNATGPAE